MGYKTRPFITVHPLFVHDSKGNDLFDETFEKPMKTIQAALSLTRSLRVVHGSDSTLCIITRGGTYYLGTNATTTSSQIGAIALTSNDSNIVIENYQDERVIVSGGTLLQLKWSVHTKTSAGGTIMKAQVPPYVNLDQFNELYIDEIRAIVANEVYVDIHMNVSSMLVEVKKKPTIVMLILINYIFVVDMLILLDNIN
jgi:hypothetical protein